MAKFTPGPLIGEIRGSIGCITFTRARYGAVARVRVKPVVSGTAQAQNAKGRFTTATQSWQSLSAAQRLAWNEWAQTNPITGSLGDSQVLTGHAAYVGNYVRALLVVGTPLLVPPIVPAPVGLATLALTADIGLGGVEIAYTATPTGANDLLWIQAAVVDSGGIVYVKNLLKLAGVSAGAEASPFDVKALIEARIGSLIVGQTLHVAVSIINDESFLLSGPLVDSAVVVTT